MALLLCDGKTLWGSIVHTARGVGIWSPAYCVYITRVSLYCAALDLAIAKAFYATGENHERAVL